jgi:hypothetical protein
VERESSLEERQRKDKEKADAIRERQLRLGHISESSEESEEESQPEAQPFVEPR